MDYLKNKDKIIGYLSKKVSKETAEDIYSDSLIKVLQYDKGINADTIDNLIFVSCTNLLKNYWRDNVNNNHCDIDDYVNILQNNDTDDYSFDFNDLDLSQLQFKILYLLKDGYNYTQVTDILKISKNTFYNNLKVIQDELKFLLM